MQHYSDLATAKIVDVCVPILLCQHRAAWRQFCSLQVLSFSSFLFLVVQSQSCQWKSQDRPQIFAIEIFNTKRVFSRGPGNLSWIRHNLSSSIVRLQTSSVDKNILIHFLLLGPWSLASLTLNFGGKRIRQTNFPSPYFLPRFSPFLIFWPFLPPPYCFFFLAVSPSSLNRSSPLILKTYLSISVRTTAPSVEWNPWLKTHARERNLMT